MRRRRAVLAPLLAAVLLPAAVLAGCDGATAPGERFTEGEIEFYVDVALGSETGGTDRFVRKWTREVRVAIAGEPTSRDREVVRRVLSDLDRLYGGAPVRRAADRGSANVRIHFVPRDSFTRVLPEAEPDAAGFVSVETDGTGEIRSGAIVVASGDELTQAFRNHVIREELTQVLGLVNDSDRFLGSIFNQVSLLPPTEYLAVDRQLVRIHGLPEIEPGMREAEIRDVLAGAGGPSSGTD